MRIPTLFTGSGEAGKGRIGASYLKRVIHITRALGTEERNS